MQRCKLNINKYSQRDKRIALSGYLLSDLYKIEAEVFKSLSTEEQRIVAVLEKLANKLKGDE